MPTVCKISLDASEYRAELTKVVSDTKAAKAEVNTTGKSPTITPKVDLKPATQSVQQASGIVQKCSGFFKKLIPSDFGASVGKGAAMVSAFGAASGASVPPVGLLAAAVNALLSPIALVTAAISGLVALGSYVWDQLTESADEYASKTAAASESAARHAEKVQKESQAAAGYIARLQEIANAESIGNSAKVETLQLLDNLQSQYGDLGAVIDDTTGKIMNMAEVESRVNYARNRKIVSAHYKSSEAQMNEAKAAYMKTASGWFDGVTEKEAGKAFDKMRKSMTPEQMLRIFEQKAVNSNSEEEIRGYNEIAAKLRSAIEALNKAKNVGATGYESIEEYKAALAKKSQQVGQATTTNILLDKAASRKKADNELTFTRDSDAKIANRQGLIDEEKKRQSGIQREVDRAQKEFDTADTTEKKLDAQKRLLDAQAQYKRSQASIADLEQQIAQIKYEQSESKRKLNEQTSFELEYNRLIAAGEYDKAAALKLEYELKQQNLKLTEEETKEILKQRKALASQKLQGNLQDQLKSLQYKAMDAAGQSKEAARLKALDDAEKLKGAALTDEEKAMVNKLSELTSKLDGISKEPTNSAPREIITNSLTARGGWKGGAVMPSINPHERQVEDKMTKINTLLDGIKAVQEELKTIVNKGLNV